MVHLHDPSLENPQLLAHLLSCILALKAGRPEACLPLLIELYREYGGRIDDVAPVVGAEEVEPYTWDRPYYADDTCPNHGPGCECHCLPPPG